MRIAHLVSGLRVGGKERVVCQLAAAGQRDGHDVSLITFDAPASGDHEFELEGIAVTHMARGPGFDVRFVRRLARHLREVRVEILHAHADSALVYGSAACLLAGRAAPALVATFHVRPSHPTPRARWLTRRAARRASVTAVSDDLSGFLVEQRWLSSDAATIGNGVDTRAFAPGERTGVWRGRVGARPTSLVVAHVGRFDPVKRQRVALEAVREVRAEGLDVRAVFVGNGPQRAEFEAGLSGDEGVLVVPHVDEMAELLRDADVLALCSEHEASPCVVLEAMACGLPVVSTDVGDVRAVLGEPPGGRIVEGRAGLVAALRELAVQPELARTLGQLAARRASDHGFDATWRRYLDVYRGAL